MCRVELQIVARLVLRRTYAFDLCAPSLSKGTGAHKIMCPESFDPCALSPSKAHLERTRSVCSEPLIHVP